MTDWRDDRDDAVLDDALVSAETPRGLAGWLAASPWKRRPKQDPDELADARLNGDERDLLEGW